MDVPVEYIEGKKGIKQIFKWYNRMDEWNKHSTPTTIDSLSSQYTKTMVDYKQNKLYHDI